MAQTLGACFGVVILSICILIGVARNGFGEINDTTR